MSARRIVGLETEFGILEPADPKANPIGLSADVVEAYAATCRAQVAWDFHGEDPLNDARGYRLDRSKADPSQLTDVADALAPSYGERPERLGARERMDLRHPRAANVVLTNGARLYVDHAHPEYSSPETINPREAVLWDRAGEFVMIDAMRAMAASGRELVCYKNNVDGKGAAYGSHENYLMSRDTNFGDVIRYLTPFFVTRQILCGAGRVGIGPRGEEPGFQISQRADYVENEVGLETTFNRPIINTRDEPHAEAATYRRLHVIGGDANLFDVSNLLKVGTTCLVIWLIETGQVPLDLDSLLLDDPVAATWQISHDPTCRTAVPMHDGTAKTAIDIQQVYLDVAREAVERDGGPDFDTAEVLDYWQKVLDALRTDMDGAAPMVEWVAKYQLLQALRTRGGVTWDDDKLRALDLQWHDLRPERSIVARLDAAGQVKRIFGPDEVAHAQRHAPQSTRAFLRGGLIDAFGEKVPAAGWDGVVLDVGGQLVRLPLAHPGRATSAHVGSILADSASPADFLSRLEAAGGEVAGGN
ncbi:MAG: depupylase/deamidase Dop [Actinomycetaceae bacterium]|nr:depupylase/deamidase Dop [Actinomycetaceae bacterium]